MVFDHAGKYLYVTTSDGFVRAYNLSTGQFDTSYNLGGSLNGLDIAADDSFLLIAQSVTNSSKGTFHKIDLVSGTTTNINYTLASSEAGGWDVAIASNGLAFITTQRNGGGWVPLRQIDLVTNTVTKRTDWPRWSVLGIEQNTQIHRSADGTVLYFLESSSSNGPVFVYNANTNMFGPELTTGYSWGGAAAAVNRDGTLLATRRGNLVLDAAPNFEFERALNGMDGGAAFDPLQDLLYAVSSATGQIVAYDTGTFTEKFRLTIGESIAPPTAQFDKGTLVASPNGRYLALATASGVRILSLPTTPPSSTPTPTPSFGTPRDMVFDHAGRHLYISTNEGFVFPYNLNTGALEFPYNLGGSLRGIDIAADDSFVLVAQYVVGMVQGTFQKLNLSTGAVTSINYTRQNGSEGGGWGVAIGSNGVALVTTDGPISDPLRQIDLLTNAVSVRNDPPSSDGFSHQIYSQTQVHRSADGSRFYFLETFGTGLIFTYSAITNSFGLGAKMWVYPNSLSAATNRDGSLLATRMTGASLDKAIDFTFVHSFGQPDGGVVFDATRDIFYVVKSSTSEIIAYDTGTFAELFRLPLGVSVSPGTPQFGAGKLVASPDGRFLALQTSSAIRVIPIPSPLPTPTPAPTPSLGKPHAMVFDHSSHYLYITTDEGFVFPYNIGTNTLENPYDLGGSLRGIDISSDDSFLIIAQYYPGVIQGAFQRLDLRTGAVTNINYTRGSSESGGWSVGIASNGLAFVTTQYAWTPLRQIDLATNIITARTDDPGTGQNGALSGTTQIAPTSNGSRVYFFDEGNIPGSAFSYDTGSDKFGPATQVQQLGTAGVTVNRNGTLVGFRPYPNPTSLAILPYFTVTHGFSNLDGGFAFDAIQDTFYGVNSSKDQVVAYDTNTLAEKFRFDIGENISAGATQFGPGLLVASQDGHYLALRTPTAIRIFGVPAVQLVNVTSVMTHGSAGTFNINLPLDGTPGIECRRGGAGGSYTIVFTFGLNLVSVGSASVTSGTGTVNTSMIDSGDSHGYIVNLTGVSNAQYIKVTLTNVIDSAGNYTGSISQQMGVLFGDTNADGFVNAGDTIQVRAQAGSDVTNSNFREDINADGFINAGDTILVRNQSGTGLPTQPAASLPVAGRRAPK
jgi:hypothetical protein